MSKQYEAPFKLEVARMEVDQRLSVAQVVKDMDIGRTAVNRWIEQYRAEQLGKTGIGEPITAKQQRIRQLESENRQLRSDSVQLYERPFGSRTAWASWCSMKSGRTPRRFGCSRPDRRFPHDPHGGR